jgi:hypothetical protein
MNDFTKEELEEILKYVSHPIWTNSHNLTSKIQSMIDNYCEHTPSDAHYEQFRWQLCKKCGAQYK